jgi:phosphatidylinositol kinase/protein kinase (PI-3  family)
MPLGDRYGLIEVVPHCTSLGVVQGDHSMRGALSSDSIVTWLAAQPGNMLEKQQQFARSLAGAIVFEHVMGLGDRHSDNILLQADGTIFHIDFGCCLGSDWGLTKSVPFNLTAQMTAVLGGDSSALWAQFRQTLVQAFMSARHRHVGIVGGLLVALGANLPHLNRLCNVKVCLVLRALTFVCACTKKKKNTSSTSTTC